MDDNDSAFEGEPRGPREIRERAIILYAVSRAAHGLSRQMIIDWLDKENLRSVVSPAESAFLTADVPTEKDRINASWRVEALEVLLWALGDIPDLSPVSGECNVERLNEVFSFFLADTASYVENCTVRPSLDIYEQCESIAEDHWVVRDADIHGKPSPENLDPGVIREKHYALNWILDGEEWDDVTCDT